MKANEPDLFLGHDVDDLPVASLGVELLNRGPVREGLIAHCVDVTLSEGAAVGPPHGLRQLRQSLLPLGLYIKGFALAKIGALKGAADDVNVFFLLRDAEVDAVVHHLAEGLELALRDIELNDLR